ncbi:methionine biosynthesis protein MetW [Cohaesibacter celericrescens]|uniref:Methionine biosynthesis protein MetW n=1 Tax=Cohaesibacter celericrescens TaxID=2067669 RepID=A0A2N5XUC2_9HYPH|nr:methionine biosynthesis protein MetW [Cohaesibacter celericrescens]PLW78045.1 methionine biosynthesis protein MetW [Cohaesibacter celericrescens]
MSNVEKTPPLIAEGRADNTRIDFQLVKDMVAPGTKILDVGSDDGALLELLRDDRKVEGRGIELSQKGVNKCVARGLSVIQGDADEDLIYYPDDSFDYVILSQTIQATHNPKAVLEHLLRIGRRAIVSFPNFGHWRVRKDLLLKGRMPVNDYLPYSWHDTPNIHFCTVRDFVGLCGETNATIEKAHGLQANGERISFNAPWWFWNIFAEQAIFLLSRKP